MGWAKPHATDTQGGVARRRDQDGSDKHPNQDDQTEGVLAALGRITAGIKSQLA